MIPSQCLILGQSWWKIKIIMIKVKEFHYFRIHFDLSWPWYRPLIPVCAIILNFFSVNNSSFGAAWAGHWPMAALKEELWTEKQFKLMTGWHTVSSLLCVELRHYYPVLLFRCLCYRINILKVLNLDIGSRVWHGRKIWYTNE